MGSAQHGPARRPDTRSPGRLTDAAEGPVMKVPISVLRPADSPRLTGENAEHYRALAATGATLPPISVHWPTMRVIDGMHRLRAAALRGESEIEVRFQECAEADTFLRAVETNIAHGLPLTLADRTAAAARIVLSHPLWSDRAIAAVTGLAAATIAAIRRCSTDGNEQSNTRIGRDGRIRPVNSTAGRTLASELMAKHPSASVREIAKAAGVAPSTALDVRRRLRRGADPVPASQRRPEPPENTVGRNEGHDRLTLTQVLRNDPSLRANEAGRTVLRWFAHTGIDPADWNTLIDQLPAHCRGSIAALARDRSRAWREFADRLDRRPPG